MELCAAVKPCFGRIRSSSTWIGPLTCLEGWRTAKNRSPKSYRHTLGTKKSHRHMDPQEVYRSLSAAVTVLSAGNFLPIGAAKRSADWITSSHRRRPDTDEKSHVFDTPPP